MLLLTLLPPSLALYVDVSGGAHKCCIEKSRARGVARKRRRADGHHENRENIQNSGYAGKCGPVRYPWQSVSPLRYTRV